MSRSRASRTHAHGRHEYGQNFLTDTRVVDDIVGLVAATDGPILEIGPGDGALTLPLARLGRPLTAVEIDARAVRRLAPRLPAGVELVHGDFLAHRLPPGPHVVVGNLPFHHTTAILRTLLHAPAWTDAVLVCQWEVARRRAGVGGETLMTAQWSPWFTFSLSSRVPSAAFAPRPQVDGGLLVIRRRAEPLLGWDERKAFQALAHRVYTGRGRGIGEIVRRAGILRGREVGNWLRASELPARALPRDLRTEHWLELHRGSAAGARTEGEKFPDY